MKDVFTPKQVAVALGVSEASVKRWSDKGLLPVQRTGGGHRRLPASGVMEFIRTRGSELVRPEVLGLPVASGSSDTSLDSLTKMLAEVLISGDEARCRQLIFNLYMNNHAITDIGDRVLAPVFSEIGRAWADGRIEIFQERRACEMCLRVLHELLRAMPEAPASAPVAVGGTLRDDPFALPTMLVELSLVESGWRAQSMGSLLPAETLAEAIRTLRPDMFWLSVSHIESAGQFIEEFEVLASAAAQASVPIMVGGQALCADIRRQIHYTAYGDNLKHLVAFAHTLAGTAGSGH